MLVDVEFRQPPSQIGMILSIIGGPNLIPERIAQGIYLTTHWSVDQLGVKFRERWKEDDVEELPFPDYGVCDTPSQVVSTYALNERPEKLILVCVKIDKKQQSQKGGWRWHKWGPYIGNQNPTCEYIFDEPAIDTVYTFQVYELVEEVVK